MLTGITQGDSLYWNGTDWVVTRSPMTWWELGANGSNHFTINGPGFSTPTEDPTLYVMRGMTYAFDNSSNGGSHPFRIQSVKDFLELLILRDRVVVERMFYIGQFLWMLQILFIINAPFTR